jgi:rhodanese-related sulfurtransferase
MTTNVSAKDLGKIVASGATILDVRNPPEHQEQHLIAAHEFVPLDQLNPSDFMLRRGLDKEAPVYILCRSGMRAGKAAGKFEEAGYMNTYVIEGGILACNPAETAGAGVPASAAATHATCASSPGKKTRTIEEQVRLAAGAMVLLGLLLGLVVKPVFFLLAFIAGAGLAYSGVTGDCRVAVLLGRAPWNASKTSCASATPTCSLPKTPDKPTAGGCA